MRGYCSTCKEFRSDNGLDAWSIIWKQGNPVCQRCGRFVDLNYFVNKGNRTQEIYPDNGRPKKHPEITRENNGNNSTVAKHMLFINLLKT